jgi:hypothetical protein
MRAAPAACTRALGAQLRSSCPRAHTAPIHKLRGGLAQIVGLWKVHVPAAQGFPRIRHTMSILHTASSQIAASRRPGEDRQFRVHEVCKL